MLRTVLSLVVAAILTLFALPSAQQGLKDVISSWTHLSYYPIRDMRRSVALAPQKLVNRLPDDASVPTIGREIELDRDVAAEKLHNPIPSDDASIARGDSLFHKLCRSEEHTSELQSRLGISYAVFCLDRKSTRLNSSHV